VFQGIGKAQKNSSGKSAEDMARMFAAFVAELTVRNADLVYEETLQARMTEKPTVGQVCTESLCTALEQAFPLAKNLECWKDLLERLQESRGLLFDAFKEKFGNVTHLLQNRPDDSSGIVVAFDSEYAKKMAQKTCSIAERYDHLFRLRNYSEGFLVLFDEYAKKIEKSTTNIRESLGASQASALLNFIEDTLARFIVNKANEIVKKFPNMGLNEIYEAFSITLSQCTSPALSEMGPLRDFVNALKNGGIPSPRKTFGTKFQLYGAYFNPPPVKEEKEDADQSELTPAEKREAA
jgi:hypothetical protein